uniref:Uncharacterized protein n=1 Tax=Arundo donax TaxID=35708 RepID=A0A0A8YLE6_ARUDO
MSPRAAVFNNHFFCLPDNNSMMFICLSLHLLYCRCY